MRSLGDRIKGFLAPAQKTAGAQWFIDWLKLAADEDGAQGVSIDNAYQTIAWLHIAIHARAHNLARACFKLYKGEDTEVEEGPAFDLFNYGLAGKTRYQIWEETEGWRCIRGEAIWILGWGGNVGFPRQIVIVDPKLMEAKVDPATFKVVLWTYSNGQQKIPFKPEEVIHFPTWNPSDPVRSFSGLDPIKDELTQEKQGARSNNKLIANNSIPGGVITIPGDVTTAGEAQAVIDVWEKRHRGADRAGRVAVLGSGATYERISLTPQEMQSFEMRGWNRETILAKFGVPMAAVGLGKESTPLSGTDTNEQMKAFWNLTLIPELKYFEDKLAFDFFKRFNLDLSCEFDLDDIPELQTDEKALHERLRLDVHEGMLTINEARESMGMDPVEWGDTWWQYGFLTDVKAEPEPEPEPITPNLPAPAPAKAKMAYSESYKTKHWEMVVKAWEHLEKSYSKAVKSWIFRIRQEQLHTLMENGFAPAIQHSTLEALTGEPLWNTYWNELKTVSKPFLEKAVDAVGADLKNLFGDLGIGASFNIWDTRAVDLLEYRVNKGSLSKIPGTVRSEIQAKLGEGIRSGWTETEMADSLRDVYNIVSNRAPTIARTEIGGAINDSRQAGFIEEGFKHIEWLSAKDELVREAHQIDGEITEIGQPFSNGLRYPNDPNGDASLVINCRCLALPVFDGEGVQATAPVPVVKIKEIDHKALMLEALAPLVEKVSALEAGMAREKSAPVIITPAPVTVTMAKEKERPRKKTIVMKRDENGELLQAEVTEEADGE